MEAAAAAEVVGMGHAGAAVLVGEAEGAREAELVAVAGAAFVAGLDACAVHTHYIASVLAG